ncbi:MAG: S4 domain-containing protein YaaA [Clostridia bacterium]|nr:S4 domain-containing protein YaaA [Clostridia bacterium]
MKFILETEFIKLDQLLKATDIVSSGGEAKAFIQNGNVLVNGSVETRRGKKIYKDYIVELLNDKSIKILVR